MVFWFSSIQFVFSLLPSGPNYLEKISVFLGVEWGINKKYVFFPDQTLRETWLVQGLGKNPFFNSKKQNKRVFFAFKIPNTVFWSIAIAYSHHRALRNFSSPSSFLQGQEGKTPVFGKKTNFFGNKIWTTILFNIGHPWAGVNSIFAIDLTFCVCEILIAARWFPTT